MNLTACLNESMMKALAHYCQGYLKDQWLTVWEENLHELERIFQDRVIMLMDSFVPSFFVHWKQRYTQPALSLNP